MAMDHVDKGADLTIATIPVVAKDAPGFGIMKVNGEGVIDNFVEKPKKEVLDVWQSEVEERFSSQGKHYLASMGIYMFKREVLEKLFADNPEAKDFGKEIIPDAITGGLKVTSYPFDGYWTDIGTIDSFFEANIALTDAIPDFNLFDSTSPVYTRPRLLAPSKVYGTFLNRALIADGCVIHAKKIDKAIVGIRSRVGEGTEINNVILMGADYYQTLEQMQKVDIPMGIGKDCYIENAIIDKNCSIGNNVIIKGHHTLQDIETDTYCIRDGIVVLKKKATIPHGAKIGAV
jgi:glucose-1-phosphate adenylyltransferase